MQRLIFFIFLSTLLFIFSVSDPAWSYDEAMPLDSGIVDVSEADGEYLEYLEDERIFDLKNVFSIKLQMLLAEIKDMTDPHQREQLQKIVHQLKTEREIAVKELYLEMALEDGDEVAEQEILEVLDLLYDPKSAVIPLGQPSQEPGIKGIKSESFSKNPDDS